MAARTEIPPSEGLHEAGSTASMTVLEEPSAPADGDTGLLRSAVTPDPFAGRVLSHYRLEERVGAGGMGVLYRATDLKLGRAVAIKFLARHLIGDETAKARFVREARAASALDHPNVGTVYDIAEAEGELFIAMALYEGETLKRRLEKGRLGVEEALEVLRQVSVGLEAAHRAGIVHRDIKPANVLITNTGTVKILDFGLAKLVSDSQAQTMTQAGQTMGTILYMSPEQLRGESVDARSDLWSLGVLAYEVLAGVSPFQTDSSAATVARILHEEPPSLAAVPGVPVWLAELVSRLLRKNLGERPQSASEVLKQFGDAGPSRGSLPTYALSTQRRFLSVKSRGALRFAAGAVVFLLVGTAAAWFIRRESRVHWAREQAIPEIERLIDRNRYTDAVALAEKADRAVPGDPVLAKLWPEMSVEMSVETVPPGADVRVKEYDASEGDWRYLGRSPIARVRLPRAFFRFKVAKKGFAPVEAAAWASSSSPSSRGVVKLVLDEVSAIPTGMVRVRGGKFALQIVGLDHLPPIEVPDYFIDKNEVTNEQYKQFVDAGGYDKEQYWKEPFLKDGRAIPFRDAMALFRDRTGKPGPATWELSDYPEGQGGLPVTGVSWYEAAAYASFAGKSLPTVYHWNRAAGTWASSYIVPASNFAGVALAPVGSYQGLGPFGTYDMAGNAKEWCWNASGSKRFILGGAFNEPSYMFGGADAQSPFDRAPTYGFRLAKYIAADEVPKVARDPIAAPERDYAKETPVAADVFSAFKSLYRYDKAQLDARVEAVDDGAERWRMEKVSYAAAYGNERVIAYVFLPRQVAPPFQTVVYFPGSGAISMRGSGEMQLHRPSQRSFVVKSGRAVIFPVYKSTYERGDALASSTPAPTAFYRDHVIQWSKDLGRTIDYIESRKDLDREKIAFYGLSWGAALGPLLLAVEDRIKIGILVAGGLFLHRSLPEADVFNFAPYARQPMLMVNGRYDWFYPIDGTQVPLFGALGSQPKDKRHAVFDTGHVPPNDLLMKEILDWLDHYLGPVH
jgi:formylglycine-generating enzyme required for sulfatase activity/dienelactone hydrolase